MKTRRDYVHGDTDHRTFYGQFVDAAVRRGVAAHIGKDRILASTDPHFNDIPLREWDLLPFFGDSYRLCLKANGMKALSLSDKVCINKEAAAQIREREVVFA